ncbi:hypothetical protein Tco_1083291 [Tanacetum coccineum]
MKNQLKSQLGSDFVMYNKACFVCGSFDHVHAHCKYYQRERMAKAVNTARPKTVNTTRPHSTVVNAVRFNQENAVKALACWVWRPTKLDSASITLKKYNYIDARGIYKRSRLISIADVSTASELGSIAGVKVKDKGKAIMQESEPPKKIKKRVQVQMSVEEELAKTVFEEEQAIDPVVLRYHTLQNRPFSIAEVRKNMCMYLKNQEGYKLSHFKGMCYEDIRPIFERVWDQNQAFVTKDSEIEKEVIKRFGFDLQQEFVKKDEALSFAQKQPARGSRKKSLARKRARETLSEEIAKKQKLEDDTEKEELQVYLNIVPEEESLNIESLATKYLIIDWETHILANDKYYYQIKRANRSVKHYKIFSAMLYDFNRQDVVELYILVKERFRKPSPKGYDLLHWEDLKTMIEPNEEDEIWRNQQHCKVMEFESTESNTTAKLPILILVTKMSVPVTAEEKDNKKNDVKAKSLLLMALPNEHQLTFSQYNDAKTMFANM